MDMSRSALMRPSCILPMLMLGVVPVTLAAQTVRGRLLEAGTEAPLAAATVLLLTGDSADRVVARGVTDDQGHFQLRVPAPGSYRLRITRLGYQPVISQPLDLAPGDQPLDVEVHISPVPILLDPVTIVFERPASESSLHLENAGFYERRRRYGREGLGLGEFLQREEIKKTNPTRVSDALRTVRGVTVRGAGGARQAITLRGHGSIYETDGRCVPQVYVDGAPAATGADIDDLVSPSSLAGIEVYPGLSVPVEFWRDMRSGTLQGQACGAIVLWTGAAEADADDVEPPATGTDQELVRSATRLALQLALATDSVTPGDTLWATIAIRNLADSTRSLCVTESRFVVRGSSPTGDLVTRGERGACLQRLDLPPRTTRWWREPLIIGPRSGVASHALIQAFVRVGYGPCDEGDECTVELRSSPQPVAFSHHERR